MARVRRKARATMRMRLNLEIAGIGAFVLALLFGIALAAPAHSGALAPARNVQARLSLSPVVRNVRRPSKW